MATFVGIATSDSNFSVLVNALKFIDAQLPGSNLVATLNDPHVSLTVFAPTNAAFGALAKDLGFAGDTTDTGAVTQFLVDNVPVETLKAVVTYHVSPTAQTASDIASSGSVATLQGATIGAGALPTLTDNEPDLINPSLVATDIMADNGVLHVIDRVLLPVDLPGNDAPSITEIVAASGTEFDQNPADFDILLKAVVTAGLGDTLASDDVDLTVFAPTDAAFVGLAQDLGFHGDDEADAWGYLVDALTVLGKGDPVPLLTTILTYHVAGEPLQASQVLTSESIATLAGPSIGVDGASLVDADPDIANPNIVATDIQASNGIVHVIDGVLVPVDLFATAGSSLEIGDDGRDFFRTGNGDDFVNAKGGNDYISLGSGNDVALAGDGRDFVRGDSGDDFIDGGAGRDFLSGGRGDDTLNGGEGRDVVKGGSGDDIVNGGAGSDLLFGGRGNDTFVFNEGDGQDRVFDFNLHADKVDLSSFNLESLDDVQVHDRWFGTQIEMGNGDTLTLSWVDADHLTTDNFIL